MLYKIHRIKIWYKTIIFQTFFHVRFIFMIEKRNNWSPFNSREEKVWSTNSLLSFSMPINKKTLFQKSFHFPCTMYIYLWDYCLKKAFGKSIIYFHTAKNALYKKLLANNIQNLNILNLAMVFFSHKNFMR